MIARIAVALFAIASSLSGAAAQAAKPIEKVVLGYPQTATDIGLYVADKRGYFRDEGIQVEFINFDSASRMIIPLVAGDLDVAAGAASSAFYNAVAGVDFRIVAALP